MQSGSMELQSRSAPQAASILVVEDEVIVRLVICDELRDEGYRVIEAMNADEAVQILQSGAEIDLIFTDVRMPGSLDGLGLFRYVQKSLPGILVVMTSGHLDGAAEFIQGGPPFLPKPCSSEQVLDVIRKELAKLP